MFQYALIFLVFAIFFINVKEENSKSNKGLYFLAILLIMFIGFRDMIGGFDVYIYAEVFETKLSWIMVYKPFEIGFKYYYLFLRLFSDNRHFMFLMTALISIGIHFSIIKKYSPILFFSIYIYFCKYTFISFVYLRQILAMCLVWIAMRFVIKRQLHYFLLFVYLATTFHKSAILFLPIYFIGNKKISNSAVFISSLLALIVAISPLSRLLFSGLADTVNEDKLNLYLTEDKFKFNSFYLIEAILILALMMKYKAEFVKEKTGQLIYNGMFAYILVSILAVNNASFVRFGWYFYIFVIIGLTYIMKFIQEDKFKTLYKFLIFLYFALIYFRLFILLPEYLPYKSIFQDFDRHGFWEWMEYRNK